MEPNTILSALVNWEMHGEAPCDEDYERMRNLAWRLQRAVDEIGRLSLLAPRTLRPSAGTTPSPDESDDF